jgi:hypothetical protein
MKIKKIAEAFTPKDSASKKGAPCPKKGMR